MPLDLEQRLRQKLIDLSWSLDYPLSGPEKVIFLLTHRCPLHCAMCWTFGDDRTGERPVEQWLAAIDQLPALGTREVMFSGGEPLLRFADVVALIRRAGERGLKASVITSSFNLSQEKLQELYEAGLNCLMNSLDGPDAEVHDAIRGRRGSFAQVLRTMQWVREIRRRPRPQLAGPARREDFSYGTMTVVLKQNHGQLAAIHDLAAEQGADFITFQAVTADGREKGLWIEEQELPELRRQIALLLERQEQLRKITVARDFLAAIPEYFAHPEGLAGRRCLAGFNDFIIQAQGGVSTCFGTIFDPAGGPIDVARLWRMGPMRELRRRMRECTRPCFLGCWTDDSERVQDGG